MFSRCVFDSEEMRFLVENNENRSQTRNAILFGVLFLCTFRSINKIIFLRGRFVLNEILTGIITLINSLLMNDQ